MRRLVLALILPSLALSACVTHSPAVPVVAIEAVEPEPTGWRALVSPQDMTRLAMLPMMWTRARAAVPRRQQAKLRAETELVDPAAALELSAPPPGPYRCRLLRFSGRAGFVTFPPDFCYVDGGADGLSFTKQTGENLPGGWLHPDTPTRHVFLGATPKPGAKGVPLYGADPARDVAGVVERVSPFRWRLVLARPGRGSLLDIYELVPVTPEVPGATPAVPARD
jgi:hypothetical protein